MELFILIAVIALFMMIMPGFITFVMWAKKWTDEDYRYASMHRINARRPLNKKLIGV